MIVVAPLGDYYALSTPNRYARVETRRVDARRLLHVRLGLRARSSDHPGRPARHPVPGPKQCRIARNPTAGGPLARLPPARSLAGSPLAYTTTPARPLACTPGRSKSTLWVSVRASPSVAGTEILRGRPEIWPQSAPKRSNADATLRKGAGRAGPTRTAPKHAGWLHRGKRCQSHHHPPLSVWRQRGASPKRCGLSAALANTKAWSCA